MDGEVEWKKYGGVRKCKQKRDVYDTYDEICRQPCLSRRLI